MEKDGIDLGGERGKLLKDLEFIVPTAANAKHYAEILKEKTESRQAIFDADKLIRAASSGVPADIARVRAEIAKREDPGESDSSIDAADLSPAPPREHIVKDLIPRGIAIVLHGPPGTGKSVLFRNMTLAVAGGQAFYGIETLPGRVVYVSNEWAEKKEISRIWYEKTRQIPRGRLLLEPSGPILEWVQIKKDGSQKEEWVWTRKGREILRNVEKMRPDLIIFDTILGLCSGIEQLNNAMTYALGDLLQKQIASKFNVALIAVAHTNQASSKECLESRLHYEAIAGGNGLPGAVLMTIGLTKVRASDFGKDVSDLSRDLVAVGSSKYNIEGFRPCWTDKSPGYFSWGRSGLELDSNPLSATIRKEKEPTRFKTFKTAVTVTAEKGTVNADDWA
nr:AAA family ATPase [Leptospirillum ferriphilum]